ncbi:MAG: ribonuclease III [Clostridia bacterium]|jgi:ribonuclease-3|nr:ribonuclease III [Clostridia bacterium]
MLNPQRKAQLEQLLIQLKLKDEINLELVDQALTHPSYIFEGRGASTHHNQRLEFLGDAVIGLVVGQYLYEKLPQKTEGVLTKTRAAIVCEASLVQGAKALRLGEYLLLGRGEQQMGGAERASNLADCFEAFIGALYLSLGLEKVRAIILRVLKQQIRQAIKGEFGDFKTELQEYIQKDPRSSLGYKILQEKGPDHDKKFWAAVYLNEEELARGIGKTKKEAEQNAAMYALQKLGVEK